MSDLLVTGPEHAVHTVVLAHGAGAPMDSPFMDRFAGLLAARGLRVARFEFAYMASRRDGGGKRPPPRAERLIPEYQRALGELGRGTRPIIGGKSLGGRVASLCAEELYAAGMVAGLVCLGYPFHPTGHPERRRTAHLRDLTCPTLICQGERDPFGGMAAVESYGLPDQLIFDWAPDGDHDLAPRKASGHTLQGNLEAAADTIAAWAGEL